ncbi:Hsp20/alpha crystallin family protein [Domibacillus indicus]|uniref:Hsp20/alpha crystallin family protein n=1 Tax=Domibacillus indicus TaxID=1437523 RepID=UPI00069623F5|nr:Hsp20/alpha crystallin family protein [Domibacillus indicus]
MEPGEKKPSKTAGQPLNQFMGPFDLFFSEPFRHFGDFLNRGSFSVDLHETAAELVVEARLPGFKKEQIQVELLRGDRLRISAEHSETSEAKKEESVPYYTRRTFGKMERIIPLPVPVVADTPKATYQDGLVKVFLKKEKRRFIKID